jgi:hypothetical protein
MSWDNWKLGLHLSLVNLQTNKPGKKKKKQTNRGKKSDRKKHSEKLKTQTQLGKTKINGN